MGRGSDRGRTILEYERNQRYLAPKLGLYSLGTRTNDFLEMENEFAFDKEIDLMEVN